MARMKRVLWVVAGVVAIGAVIAWLAGRERKELLVLDLATELPHTVRNLPRLDAFSVKDVTIGGMTKRAIVVDESSRLAWHLTVPEDAWLKVSLGVREEAWTAPGRDVGFRVTVYDEPLLTVTLDPYTVERDRHWQDFRIDLSEYAGETIDIYLKTDQGDRPAWGEPVIVTR
jgi:hypothetical protein